MGIVTFAVICLIQGATFALAKDRERVTNAKTQIPEFLFDCHTMKVNWISPCEEFRSYLMIYDSQGNFFQEKRRKITNIPYLRTSSTKKAKKPTDDDILRGKGYPDYLFQLERVHDHPESFYIATKSGQLLVAENEVYNPSLLLREDHCSKLHNDSKLQASSSASTTEFSVAIHDWLMSTTPTAITTSAPIQDYDCNQAHWKLWKEDLRYLLIESVSKPSFFLNVEPRTNNVSLGFEQQKMTGIKTSFLKNITLERTAGQGEPGIGDDAYGDLVVHYFGRNGSLDSGYVCDYDWTQESATSVCTYLGLGTMGIPTYDGQYSNQTTPQYALSGLMSEDENINEWKFRTLCDSHSFCLTQNSMKPFGGKGYACNRGSSTDIAGLICGNETQVNNIMKRKVTCNRNSLANDRKNVAGMFSIYKQMKTVRSSMFEHKHWSEYLLPMPMAVSLISALLLVSSQNDQPIELAKPSKGVWDHLKYDHLQPNLISLSLTMKNNFVLSNSNMGVIKRNSLSIHDNMKDALQLAFSRDSYDYKTMLPRKLNAIAEDANKNKEKAKEVHTAFKNTTKIIDELLSGLENTQTYQRSKKSNSVKALKQLNNTYVRDQEELKNKMQKKQEYDAKVTESRKAFFDAAKEAMNSQCVNEIKCNSCIWSEPKELDTCNTWNKVCKGGWEDVCGGWKKDKKITGDEFHCSGGYTKHCKKWGQECIEYNYRPAGSYCQDSGRGGLCTRCKWADEVSKSLETVTDFTVRMQHSVLNDETSYSAVESVIEDLVSQVDILDQEIQSYKEWKAASEIVSPIDNTTKKAMNNDTSLKQLKPLELIKLSVDMDINLLNQDKIPIAIKARHYAVEIRGLLESLITRKVKVVGEMTEEEKIFIRILHTKGKAILNKSQKLTRKHEITTDTNTASGDHVTGKLAIEHLEFLGQRHKTEKVIESLANRMKNAIEEMFKQDFAVQDINSIILKLTKCSRYLNLLNKQWVVLQNFFDKIAQFLDGQKKSLRKWPLFILTLEIL